MEWEDHWITNHYERHPVEPSDSPPPSKNWVMNCPCSLRTSRTRLGASPSAASVFFLVWSSGGSMNLGHLSVEVFPIHDLSITADNSVVSLTDWFILQEGTSAPCPEGSGSSPRVNTTATRAWLVWTIDCIYRWLTWRDDFTVQQKNGVSDEKWIIEWVAAVTALLFTSRSLTSLLHRQHLIRRFHIKNTWMH